MIFKLLPSNISFCSNNSFQEEWDKIPTSVGKKYANPNSSTKTVAIMGSSKSTNAISDSVELSAEVTKDIVQKGYNIVTGCGSNGVMGAAYNAAKENSIRDIKSGKPSQNLAIVMTPPWGDEDIQNCVAICKASSEDNRITKFRQVADTFIIFPGSATSIKEATSLIQQNEYAKSSEPLKKIILVGKEFFRGLVEQYQKLFDSKLLKHSPEELFKVLDDKDAILKEIKGFSKLV